MEQGIVQQVQGEKAIDAMNNAEIQSKNNARNTWVNVKSVMPQLDGFPELGGMFKMIAESGGYPIKEEGGMQFIQGGGIEHVENILNTNPVFQKKTFEALKIGYKNQIDSLKSQLQPTDGKANPKQIPEIQTRLSQLTGAYTDLVNKEDAFDKTMAAQQEKPVTAEGLVSSWL